LLMGHFQLTLGLAIFIAHNLASHFSCTPFL